MCRFPPWILNTLPWERILFSSVLTLCVYIVRRNILWWQIAAESSIHDGLQFCQLLRIGDTRWWCATRCGHLRLCSRPHSSGIPAHIFRFAGETVRRGAHVRWLVIYHSDLFSTWNIWLALKRAHSLNLEPKTAEYLSLMGIRFSHHIAAIFHEVEQIVVTWDWDLTMRFTDEREITSVRKSLHWSQTYYEWSGSSEQCSGSRVIFRSQFCSPSTGNKYLLDSRRMHSHVTFASFLQIYFLIYLHERARNRLTR